ncbi:hypothetical protein QYF61_010357 [Mycteria americana]|uniref:Uncharacterized protein n=1 Tax=Mycteria americana TaxID=33587 RepID=A0AAN7S329_MYCAM|nr:hypothetical protein QYF61_010357 [Mycteria americana]
MGAYKKDGERLFIKTCTDRTMELSPLHTPRPFSDWCLSSDPYLQLEERTSPCLWKRLARSPALSVLGENWSLTPEAKGWRLNHFPGQSVPMLDNPLSEEKFPNIQSKPPLAQLEAISSCPITCYLGEETDPHLSTTSFQLQDNGERKAWPGALSSQR